uniref:Uncharacterized protein n=1 Tax=Arundo donax TaxID=35708 RepID=A0A0A9QX71_ARUDO
MRHSYPHPRTADLSLEPYDYYYPTVYRYALPYATELMYIWFGRITHTIGMLSLLGAFS